MNPWCHKTDEELREIKTQIAEHLRGLSFYEVAHIFCQGLGALIEQKPEKEKAKLYASTLLLIMCYAENDTPVSGVAKLHHDNILGVIEPILEALDGRGDCFGLLKKIHPQRSRTEH